MNMRRFWLAGCLFAFSADLSLAVPRYVSPSGGNVFPYDTWEHAATTIQPAISACAEGDEVLVTNGIYATGGVAVFGAMTNRIAITNAIVVSSVNGPAFTAIVGQGPVGPAAIRCAWIASNAVLAGFTLTNGHTLATGDNQREINGGGAWCEYEGGTISNCVIAGCEAAYMGGGFYQGQVIGTVMSNNAAMFGGGGSGSSAALVDRCVFVGNRSVRDGGGLYSGKAVRNSHFTGNVAGERGGGLYGVWNVESCTVAGNSAEEVGGAAASSVSNSIVYYNADQFGSPNVSPGGAVGFSCTTPDPGGVGNVTNAPGLAGLRNPHLVTNSPCIDQGTNSAWMATAIDVDGEPRLVGTVDMGCDEVVATNMVAGLFVSIECDRTNAVVGVPIRFHVEIQNRPTKFTWNWGDGTGATNETVAEHAYAAAGEYVVTVQAWNRFGFATNALNVRIHAGFTNYVAKTGGNVPPYDTWATAATNIQDAVNHCAKGGTVLVSNGVYAGGGAERFSSNRVAITNAMIVRSVNGPTQTAIRGVASTGLDAMRGAYVGNGAQLIGFGVTGGRSRGSSVPIRLIGETLGGGIFAAAGARIADCLVTNNGALNGGGACGWGTFTNCVLADNSAANSGGGALYGVFVDCQIGPDNEAKYGAGLAQADAENCLIATNWASENGGGAYISTLRRCRVEGNSSALHGGGISYGRAENCLILFNEARNGNGGGSLGAALRQCTVRGNDASGTGGGTYAGAVDGSIVYFNYAAANDNVFLGDGSLDYSCTFPDPGTGTGNITNDPQFVAWDGFPPDFHLLATSPCIDAGNPLSTVTNDYAGLDRPRDGNNDGTNIVDMGAYEYVFAPPSLEIVPALTNVPAIASTGRMIAVAANVPWTAVAQVPWLVVTDGESEVGNGMATFGVEANGSTSARTGTITVAGGGLTRTCTVIQAGSTPVTLDIAPTNSNAPASATSGRQIAVSANIAWLAATNVPWLVITGGTSGSGNGTITYSVMANGGVSGRTGTITVAAGGGLVRTCTVVQAGIRPDFAVAELLMTPPDPATGRTFKATARVLNQGTATGHARYLSLWLDHPGAAAVGERGEARRISVGTLKAGQSRTVKISGLKTPRAAGSHVLRAFIDSANRTAESDEDNNQATAAYQAVAPYVDLEVVDVDVAPLWPLPGKRLTSYVTLLNRGNVAGRPAKLGLWTNQAAEVACGTPANRSKTVGALQPWKPRRQTVTGLVAPSPAGPYPMRAFVDSDCLQAESSEANNQGTLEYWVYDPTPNLTATKIVLSPTRPRAGQAFSAAVTVKNTGTGPGPVGRLGVYLDRADAPVPANAPDRFADIPRVLAPGSGFTVKLAGLTAPAVGARTLWVLVDALDAAAELSEIDNARSRSYTVLP